MKKAIAVFLCIMLTTGMISGCAGREQGGRQLRRGILRQRRIKRTRTLRQKRDRRQKKRPARTGRKAKSRIQQETDAEETDGSQEETQDRDMTEDLAMSVLKDQAGTVDYTSLEELNPEPGIRIAVVLKSAKDDFWTTVREGIEDGVEALNEKMGYTGEDQITVSFDAPSSDHGCREAD